MSVQNKAVLEDLIKKIPEQEKSLIVQVLLFVPNAERANTITSITKVDNNSFLEDNVRWDAAGVTVERRFSTFDFVHRRDGSPEYRDYFSLRLSWKQVEALEAAGESLEGQIRIPSDEFSKLLALRYIDYSPKGTETTNQLIKAEDLLTKQIQLAVSRRKGKK